jgi:hypothetical protein
MRLLEYVSQIDKKNEELKYDITEKLINDCSEFLEVLEKIHNNINNCLWRGSHRGTKDIDKFIPRIDRIPTDTAEWLHNEWDKMFKEKFGWKARSEGVFVTSRYSFASGFGNAAHLFFPFDGYKFIWSPNIEDMTVAIGGGKHADDNRKRELIKKSIEEIKAYKNSDLEEAIESEHEIMFKCHSYYLVNRDKISIKELIEIYKSKEQVNPNQQEFSFMFGMKKRRGVKFPMGYQPMGDK